jgi:hypothetical protein
MQIAFPDGLRWYLPTFHGDVQLTSRGPSLTEVRAFDLTPDEEYAVSVLRQKALKPGWGREPWADERAFVAVSSPSYRTKEGLTIELRAPIRDVQRVLARALKPGRKLLTAVRFSGGKVEEVSEPEFRALDETPPPALPSASPVTAATALAKPEAAATVAAPVIGCPEPAFPEADLRAARVLEVFLDEVQREDFHKHRAFVAVGADTGHRYLITDRERPKRQAQSFRSLYDLDERRPLCVHDWLVPPPEEMLALLLCVSLPGRERYVRDLPETWH